MRKLNVLLVVLAGCGGRIEETPPPPAEVGVVDSGAAPVTDGGLPTKEAAPVDPEPPPPKGDGPYLTALSVCSGGPTYDKLLIHVSEAVAPVAKPADLIHITPGGTTCTEVFDDRSPTGEYAFGAPCGHIDPSLPITIRIDAGIVGRSGKPMAAGTYKFHSTGRPGLQCGIEFVP